MTISKTFTIDEALESVGFGHFQWILLALSGVGFFATTVELISMSILKMPLRGEWQYVDNERFALLMSATFAGELIGGLLWGTISDRLGRRTAFLGTALMAAIFGVAGSMAPGIYIFALTRFFLGIAIGGSLSIDFVYFVEFVPATRRGFRTTFIILLGVLACIVFLFFSALTI